MTTSHLIDPELVASLDTFPALELTNERVVQMRAMIQEMGSHMPPNLPAFPDISVSERFVPGPEGRLWCGCWASRWRPSCRQLPCS